MRLKHKTAQRLWVLVLLLLALFLVGKVARADAPCVTRAELRSVVSAGTASYLKRAVFAAERDGCSAVLVPLDTPGGALDATREIVATFLDARVPIVVYVSPAAARAGSAGAFITLAAHVAAMSPASNIGAAHPVMIGSDGSDKELASKIENDTAALARAIAERRERNVEWAEAAVRESASITASEAHELGVVDVIAGTEQELLDLIDGRTVRVGNDEIVLRTANAELRDHEMTVRERALAVLGNPNVAYTLMTIGMLALMFELFTPGLGVSGVLGAVSLLLGVIGLNVLPVHAGGVILLVVALAFFVAELYVASYGLLSLAGVACLLIGGALLFDRSDPSFLADASVRLSWSVVVPLAVVLGGAAVLLGVQATRSRRRRSPTGLEGLRDEVGSTIEAVDARGGAVRVHGERWNAVSDEPLPERTPVRVVDVHGLTLHVTRAEHSGGAT